MAYYVLLRIVVFVSDFAKFNERGGANDRGI